MTVQPDLCRTCSETTLLVFPRGRLISKTRFTDDPCALIGNWMNELGSCVKFESCENGHLTGQYYSAKGDASSWYKLHGTYTTAGLNDKDIVLGFSVPWNNEVHGNSHSTTSWTGTYYHSTRTIYTTWLLTSFKLLGEKWNSTNVYQDTFKRSNNCGGERDRRLKQ